MGIFSSIVSKIVAHAEAAVKSVVGAVESTFEPASSGSSDPSSSSAAPPSLASQPSTGKPVDVDATLKSLAEKKGGGGNWRTSIVDLLKLLDLDSSLSSRKALAEELDVHAAADGTAEQNIALQKAVMQKLAENGGDVPADLRG